MGNRVSDDSSLCQLRKIYGKSVFQRAKQATYEQCRFVLRNNVDYLFKKEWHGRQELNPQPTDLESVALPIELQAYPWSWQRDLNPQPADYKSAALPVELCQHNPSQGTKANTRVRSFRQLVKPATPSVRPQKTPIFRALSAYLQPPADST